MLSEKSPVILKIIGLMIIVCCACVAYVKNVPMNLYNIVTSRF